MRLDYSRKSYANNPLFKKSLIRRKPSMMRKMAYGFLVGIVASAALWAVFLSGFFGVRDVQVSGNERVPAWEVSDYVKEQLSGRIGYIIPENNILTLSEEELSKALIERFVLESVEITKHPPSRLDIVIKERISSIMLKLSDGTRATLGLDGAVLRVYKPEEPYEPAPGEKIHVLVDDKDAAEDLKEKVIHATIIEAVIALPELVQKAFGTVEVTELHIESKASRTLHIITNEGWGMYVDAFEPLEAQLANAELVLRTKVAADRPRLDYIDARFGEKVFFKLR